MIKCRDCGAIGPFTHGVPESVAWEKWNARFDEPRPDPLFAVVIVSLEAHTSDNKIITEAGTKFVVIEDREYPTDGSSSRFDGRFPFNTKTFPSPESAESFARSWHGHPWWCRPSGTYEIHPIIPVYRKVIDGYRLKT